MSAPERIWAVHWGADGAVTNGGWADTVRHFGGGVEYVRADLCACAQSKPDQNFTVADVRQAVRRAIETCRLICLDIRDDEDTTDQEAIGAHVCDDAIREFFADTGNFAKIVEGRRCALPNMRRS